MNWGILGIMAAFGLFVFWGNKRLRKGKRPPEESRWFGALILIAFGIGMYVWLHETGQL